MKLNAKKIITLVLTAAIALTGILTETITADAAIMTYDDDSTDMEDARLLKNTTVTMTVGDTKMINFTEPYGTNNKTREVTKNYSWSSSDESVVSMRREWVVNFATVLELTHCVIKAEKPGTAVITGVDDYAGDIVSFTITVQAPKVTAKQRACKKHVWKTIKKATCLESGMKACKKCKMQRVITKKDHTFETESKAKYDYTYYRVYQCGACINEDPAIREQHFHNEELCEDWCEETFSAMEYGSDEAAKEALGKHYSETGHFTGLVKYIQVPAAVKTTYKDVTICKSCGYSNVEVDLMFQVNDPSVNMTEKDLINAIYNN